MRRKYLPDSPANTLLLSCTVLGRAATLTAHKRVAEPWKRAVADAVGAEWTNPFIAYPVAVELEFGLTPTEFRSTALHNLLKAAIDGLSLPLFAAGRHGHRTDWNREDGWITSLSASKHPSENDRLAIRVRTADAPPAIKGITVSGRPAPWVTAGEAAWKAAVVEAARRHGFPMPPSNLTAVFTLDPRSYPMTDIDNLAVPLVSALSGPVRNGATALTTLRIWKQEGTTDTRGLTFA